MTTATLGPVPHVPMMYCDMSFPCDCPVPSCKTCRAPPGGSSISIFIKARFLADFSRPCWPRHQKTCVALIEVATLNPQLHLYLYPQNKLRQRQKLPARKHLCDNSHTNSMSQQFHFSHFFFFRVKGIEIFK